MPLKVIVSIWSIIIIGKNKDNEEMNKMAIAATFVALFTANAQADTVGLYLGGQVWQSETSGVLGEKNALIDFNLKKEQQVNYFIAIEHPFPLLPNIRIARTALDTTGGITSKQAFNFGGETFAVDDIVNASVNVSYIDYTLYYQLFDNDLFSFDLGLTARDFNGDVTITGPTIPVDSCIKVRPDFCVSTAGESLFTPTGKIKTDEIVPMLYAATNISLPVKGLGIFAQGVFLSIGDHSLYDYQVGLSYNLAYISKLDFELNLGYRAVKIGFEDLDSLYTNLEFKGAFVGVIAHF
jgi:hypothetical protein